MIGRYIGRQFIINEVYITLNISIDVSYKAFLYFRDRFSDDA